MKLYHFLLVSILCKNSILAIIWITANQINLPINLLIRYKKDQIFFSISFKLKLNADVSERILVKIGTDCTILSNFLKRSSEKVCLSCEQLWISSHEQLLIIFHLSIF